MDELQKGLEIGLKGPDAEKYRARALEHISSWGMQMPAADALVLDFGLGDFQRFGEIEFWIANEAEEGYCGKFLFVFEGQTCPAHMHKVKTETFFIVRGTVEMEYDGIVRTLSPGAVLRVATGVFHRFTALEPALLLEVSKPSIIADNFFENSRIPIGGNYVKERG